MNKRRSTDNIDLITTIIGDQSCIEGKITGTGAYMIQGEFIGNVEIDGTLLVVEGGKLTGNVIANAAIISGDVTGDLKIRENLEIKTTGRIQGAIRCDRIAMATGAVHDGELHMSSQGHVTEFEERRKSNDIRY